MKIHNQIFYKSAQNMSELDENSVNLIITSPPYFNIKDYAKNGHQIRLIHKKIQTI